MTTMQPATPERSEKKMVKADPTEFFESPRGAMDVPCGRPLVRSSILGKNEIDKLIVVASRRMIEDEGVPNEAVRMCRRRTSINKACGRPLVFSSILGKDDIDKLIIMATRRMIEEDVPSEAVRMRRRRAGINKAYMV
jgi:hypothetical protein